MFSHGVEGSFKALGEIKEIAERKMVDLNANDIEAAARMIKGSAQSMGLEVVEAA